MRKKQRDNDWESSRALLTGVLQEEGMEQSKKKAVKGIWIALILCVVSMVGASLVQSSGGRVTVKDLRWETTSGHQLSGLLFVPKGVNAKNPVPAIVVNHGVYNSREMQDANYIELSRRGFVVVSIDMFGHGHSENSADNFGSVLPGMYEAVKMLDSLNYVDSSRIGIAGHSMGAMSSNMAVMMDNRADRQLISAVLLNSANAEYANTKTGEFINIYGSRDTGMVAGKYDEFFFRQDDGKGGQTVPRDFLKYSNAQSFLYFGTDPGSREKRAAETMYRETIDGKSTVRIIYNPTTTHPWANMTAHSAAATIEFFDEAFKAPNPLAKNNQVWQWKAFFNLLGLIGFGLFVINFSIFMVFTPFFASLRAEKPHVPVILDAKGKGWYWSGVVLSTAFSALTFLPLSLLLNSFVRPKIIPQNGPWVLGIWAMIGGLFTLLYAVIGYKVFGKKKGFNLAEHGILIPAKELGKSFLLAVIVVFTSYGIVFLADYLFRADFRFYLLAIKTFNAELIPIALFPPGFLFLIFFTAISISINGLNYNNIGKTEWGNILIISAISGAGPAVLLLLQYGPFPFTGELFFSWSPANMVLIGMVVITVMLPLLTIIMRKIFKEVNNPYVPGFICGLLFTIINCSNTLTWAW
jgi:pimeloyl-ACP methyl ester carboxylesterase